MVKKALSRGRVPRQVLALPLMRYVLLQKIVSLSVPQFPHSLDRVSDKTITT